MSTLSSKLAVICLITATSMVMYGCGGGGGSSDDTAMMGDDMMAPPTPDPCPTGYMRPAAGSDCEPTQDTIDARTDAAESKETAIEQEARETDTDDAGLGGTAAAAISAGTPGSYSLSISATGVEVTIMGDPDADPVVPNTKFEATNVSDGLTMHTRTMDADMDGNVVEEIVMVSTDIESPKATPFANVYTLDADTDADTDTDNDALSVVTANLSLVMVSEFSSVPSGVTTRSFNGDNAGTTDDDEAQEYAGTYNGAPGTYRCNAGTSGCTVTYADGMVSGLTGWIFTPDAGATSDVPDSDYLRYGFWLQRTTDKDGAVMYNEVETFAGYSMGDASDISAVTGSAKYSGGALGVYMIENEFSSETGDLINASSGHFTADVNLTVYFGGTSIPADKHNTLTGTINNFMLSGGEENSWSVSLSDTDITDNGVGGGTGNDVWSANFYGPVTDGADPVAPHTIVGEFNKGFDNGIVAGAFGARMESE